ncbi:hypothetical protein AAEP93_000532 [Penicillium crustosum]
MLYNLVAKSSDEAAAFFYQMMYRSHPDLERVSIECDPDTQMDRESYYLKATMSANAWTDIVLDTWNSLYLEPHLWPQFGEDTWMWDLGGAELGSVRAERESAHTGRGWIPSSE